MSINVFWTETKRLNILGKLRNKIVLDAFCVRCGEVKRCVRCTQLSVSELSFNSTAWAQGAAAVFLSNAFTIAFWMKVMGDTNREQTLVYFQNFDSNPAPRIYLKDGKINVQVAKGLIVSTLLGSLSPNQFEWSYVAVTYDGTSIKIYVDGVQDSQSLTIAAPIEGDTIIKRLLATDPGTGNNYEGMFDEVQFWTVALSKNEVIQNRFYAKGKNAGLHRYLKFNESSFANFTYERSDTGLLYPITMETDATGQYLIDTDGAPLIYGASVLAAIFEVTAGQNISLKYPIRKPTNANFMLCVSYVDDDTDTTVRYKLWEQEGVDIAPAPVRYRGQVLPSVFKFEVWGVDGAEEAELESDLEIFFSKCSLPLNQRDTTNQQLVVDPTIDNSLAASWGSAFPITFNTAQFGTCAVPVAQILANMSNNLTVYGGTGGVAVGFLNEDGGEALNEDGGRQMLETN